MSLAFIRSTFDRLISLFTDLFNLIFKPDIQRGHAWLSRTWLAGLYLAGIGLWGIFLNWGSFSYTFEDWQSITGPRLLLLQNAAKELILPLHVNNQYPLMNLTDRFMSIPDQILSPQVLLLRYLSISNFVILDIILLYTIGFISLLWFMRKFSLSLVAFTILFLLFNFNGHILAHLAIGHFTWGSYFLFPWFALLVLQLVDGERGWGWIAKMSLMQLVSMLNGGFHQYVWCLFFLGFLAFTKRDAFFTILGGMAFSLMANLARILPPAIQFGNSPIDYLAGYQNLSDIWYGMTNILAPGEKVLVPMMTQTVQRWELTLFVGLVGGLFLVYFGIYQWLKREFNQSQYLCLALPIFGTFLLSFDRIYHWVREIPFPLIEGERVSSRIISLPFVFVVIFAVIELQRWLNKPGKNELAARLAVVCLGLVGGNDLWQDYKSWMVTKILNTFRQWDYNPSAYHLTNHADPIYITAIVAGAAGSILSIAFVLYMAYRQHKNTQARENKQVNPLLTSPGNVPKL